MDPLKRLQARLGQGVVRAWESLTEGWRELLSRSSGALTYFALLRGPPGNSLLSKTSPGGACWRAKRGRPPSR
jgi:hypothetical protein